MPIHSLERCKEMFLTLKLGDEQLCVGGIIGKDSCGGDSGGALMMVISNIFFCHPDSIIVTS